MEWRKCYLDVILVPLGFVTCMGYHVWLWNKVRTKPLSTVIGTNARGRRFWVAAMMKDNEKKNILAVQTLRNTIMECTLMATTSILICTGLAAMISSTYNIKMSLNDTVYGAHGEFMVALKYVTLVVNLLFSFICHTLAILSINQVNFVINCPPESTDGHVTPDYVSDLLERGCTLSTVGNRLFYAALPLLLWIFGPVLVFLCFVTMVPVLYHLDIVFTPNANRNGNGGENDRTSDSV